MHSDWYLDPPVFLNYTNEGNSGGILVQYEHEFGANDRLRFTFLHDTLDYIVPNDLVQLPSLVAQFGEQVVSRVNLERGRVDPNFALDLAMGAELYRKELRTLQFQLQATNVTDRLNVTNFASLFSGTAVGAP